MFNDDSGKSIYHNFESVSSPSPSFKSSITLEITINLMYWELREELLI